jgi:hypothetical protein
MPRRARPPAPNRHHLDRRARQLLAAEPPGIGHNDPPLSDEALLTTTQVAAWLGVSIQWLEIGRVRGYGPRFVRLSPRCIKYRVGDVREYLRERAHASTAEYRNSAETTHVGTRRTTRRGAAR